MSRWRPDARGRLERAAIELFATQGFAATTVPQIAAHAGLTTRTFFRHFADKREVIFAGDEIPRAARDHLAAAPADLPPVRLVLDGLVQVAHDRFAGRRPQVAAVRAIIMADEQLRERDARKRTDLAQAIREGLADRGEPLVAAALLADTAVTLLHVALDEWLRRADEEPLSTILLACAATMRDVVLDEGWSGPGTS